MRLTHWAWKTGLIALFVVSWLAPGGAALPTLAKGSGAGYDRETLRDWMPEAREKEEFAQGEVFGINLIVNGDAEAGPGAPSDSEVVPPPGWTTNGNFTVVRYGASGGLPELTEPGPADRGQNLFAGGPSNPGTSATQTVDVSAGMTSIDAGGVTFTLSAYLGGWSGQHDNAVLTLTFRNSSGAALGTASIGPVTAADRNNATGLLLRSDSGNVPPDTRSVDVVLQMTRDSGSYNDGYADNLSLVLSEGPSSPSQPVSPGVGPNA